MTDLPAIERRQEERKKAGYWLLSDERGSLFADINLLLQEVKRYREALERIEGQAAPDGSPCPWCRDHAAHRPIYGPDEEGIFEHWEPDCPVIIANNALHPEKEEG